MLLNWLRLHSIPTIRTITFLFKLFSATACTLCSIRVRTSWWLHTCSHNFTSRSCNGWKSLTILTTSRPSLHGRVWLNAVWFIKLLAFLVIRRVFCWRDDCNSSWSLRCLNLFLVVYLLNSLECSSRSTLNCLALGLNVVVALMTMCRCSSYRVSFSS